MAEMTPRQRAFYQGLLGLGAGILANNAPTRFPGGGTQALGKGLQQGLQTYNQALTMEDKLDALREERALKGQLEDNLPAMIEQAIEMGVDKNITDNATLMSSIKPSAVYSMLSNAMVKAQKRARPELTGEQLIYTDPNSKRQFRIKSDGFLGEEIKALPKEKTDQTFVVDSEMRQMIGLPENVTTGKTEGGIRKFYDKFGQQVTSFPEPDQKEEEKFQTEYFDLEEDERMTLKDPRVVRKRTTEDGDFEYLNRYNQVVTKAPDPPKEEKVEKGYKYIKKGAPNYPENAPEWADEVEISPTNQRVFRSGGMPGKPPKQKEEPFQETTVPLEIDEMNALGDPRVKFKTLKGDGTVSYLDQYYTPVTEPLETSEPEPVTPLFMSGAELKKREPALASALKLDDGDIFQIAYNDKGKPTNAFKPDWTKDKPVKEQPTYMTKAQALGGNTTEKAFANRMGDKDFLLKTGGKYSIEKMTKEEKPLRDTKEFTTEQALRKEYTARSKDFTGAVNAYQAMLTGAQQENGQGDLMLIQAFQKMLDPTSVVRETEFANAQNTQGLLDKLLVLKDKVEKGELLTPQARAKFIESARDYMSQVKESFEPIRTEFAETASYYNLRPGTIKDPFSGVQGLSKERARIDFKALESALDNKAKTSSTGGVKKESPQASAGGKIVEKIRSAVTSESPPGNIENDEELESILK